jgi:hypothetical protein
VKILPVRGFLVGGEQEIEIGFLSRRQQNSTFEIRQLGASRGLAVVFGEREP